MHRNVVGLVYVSALAPDAGETTAQQYEGFAPTPEFVIETHSDGFGFLSLEKFKSGFAHDVSDADAAFLRDSQVPIDMSAFATPVQHAAWRAKPSWAGDRDGGQVLRPGHAHSYGRARRQRGRPEDDAGAVKPGRALGGEGRRAPRAYRSRALRRLATSACAASLSSTDSTVRMRQVSGPVRPR